MRYRSRRGGRRRFSRPRSRRRFSRSRRRTTGPIRVGIRM